MDVRLRYCIHRLTVTYYVVLYLCQLILPPYTGWVKNWDHIPTSIILSNLNRLTQIFSGKFLSKFVVKWALKITPHLGYVTTLSCESLMSAKQLKPLTINYKVV